MVVLIQVKNAGGNKPVLEKKRYVLPDEISCLRQLICELVALEVAGYQQRSTDASLYHLLSDAEIQDGCSVGKVGFGQLSRGKQIDLAQAQKNALLCFTDGLYRVICNDTEVSKLDAPLQLSEGDTLTFLRLTFLSWHH